MNLITGAASGLGLAVYKAMGGVPFVRGDRVEDFAGPWDSIIHCAFNSAKEVSDANAYDFLQDNVLLAQKLVTLPHRRFVYISSVDALTWGFYSATKVFSEALVRKEAGRPLILRPVTLLGVPMRRNTIYRMLTEPKPKLFLSARSRFNLVLHNDVIDAMKTDYDGTFTVAAADTITLGEIAERLNLKPEFGAHDYDVGNITPSLTRSSWGTLELFRAML